MLNQIGMITGDNVWSLGAEEGERHYQGIKSFLSFFCIPNMINYCINDFNDKKGKVILFEIDYVSSPLFFRFYIERPDIAEQIGLVKRESKDCTIKYYSMPLPSDWDMVLGLLRVAGYSNEHGN